MFTTNRKKALVGLFIALFSLMPVATAFAAYTAVQGTVIDSLNHDPWVHGADVVVINISTSQCIGSGSVTTADGTFNITYGTDGLGLGSCNNSGAGDFDTIRVIIDYECSYSGGGNCTGGNTGGTPPPNEVEYTNFGTGTKNLQNIETGTGPTAVSLQSFSTGTGNMGVLLPLMAGLLLLAGTSFVVLRRRREA